MVKMKTPWLFVVIILQLNIMMILGKKMRKYKTVYAFSYFQELPIAVEMKVWQLNI